MTRLIRKAQESRFNQQRALCSLSQLAREGQQSTKECMWSNWARAKTSSLSISVSKFSAVLRARDDFSRRRESRSWKPEWGASVELENTPNASSRGCSFFCKNFERCDAEIDFAVFGGVRSTFCVSKDDCARSSPSARLIYRMQISRTARGIRAKTQARDLHESRSHGLLGGGKQACRLETSSPVRKTRALLKALSSSHPVSTPQPKIDCSPRMQAAVLAV